MFDEGEEIERISSCSDIYNCPGHKEDTGKKKKIIQMNIRLIDGWQQHEEERYRSRAIGTDILLRTKIILNLTMLLDLTSHT